MLKMKKALLPALILIVASVPEAAAQMQWTDKAFLNVNFGYQIGSQDVEATSNFTVYDEPATLDSTQTLESEPLLVDLTFGYRVRRNLAIALGYTNYNTESNVDVVARVPHPIITDAFRTVAVTAPGAAHMSHIFNISAVWMWPYSDKIDFAFYAGPSLFGVKQDLVSGITIVPETGPNYSNPQVSGITVTEQNKFSFGIHFGADAAYMVNQRYGVGGGIRYVWGAADVEGLAESLTLGGFQIVGGLRVRF